MNDDNTINWDLVLINAQISLYLSKPDLFNLTLTSKLIRSKLIPIYYNTIKITDRILFNQPNYFMNKKILEFGANDSWWDLCFIAKNWFNDDLAFKEAHIDPFIKDLSRQLKPGAVHCRSLSFESLGKAYYFLLPITLEFLNLRTLTLNLCVISLSKFNHLLERLTKLEVLYLNNIDITESPDYHPTCYIRPPRSVSCLTYSNINSWPTKLPLENPLQFLTNVGEICTPSTHRLLPLQLPNLLKLYYIDIAIDEEFIEFLQINCQIEDLGLPLNFLSYIKQNQVLLTNLKNLKLYSSNFHAERVIADSLNIPAFPNLEELNLNLKTNTDLEFAKLLIKKCTKLFKLNVSSNNLEHKKLKRLVKFANGVRYFNNERVIEQYSVKIL